MGTEKHHYMSSLHNPRVSPNKPTLSDGWLITGSGNMLGCFLAAAWYEELKADTLLLLVLLRELAESVRELAVKYRGSKQADMALNFRNTASFGEASLWNVNIYKVTAIWFHHIDISNEKMQFVGSYEVIQLESLLMPLIGKVRHRSNKKFWFCSF